MGSRFVHGEREIIDIINLIGPTVGKKAMRQSLRRGAKFVVEDAKALAPRDTGQLERSISARAQKRSRTSFGYSAIIKPDSPAAKYGFALEFGTKHIAADPFLRQAGYANRQKTYEFAVVDVKRVLRSMGRASRRARLG